MQRSVPFDARKHKVGVTDPAGKNPEAEQGIFLSEIGCFLVENAVGQIAV